YLIYNMSNFYMELNRIFVEVPVLRSPIILYIFLYHRFSLDFQILLDEVIYYVEEYIFSSEKVSRLIFCVHFFSSIYASKLMIRDCLITIL
ncbi:hypothetical protein L9F63_019130, partial [Diploptera punctata]